MHISIVVSTALVVFCSAGAVLAGVRGVEPGACFLVGLWGPQVDLLRSYGDSGWSALCWCLGRVPPDLGFGVWRGALRGSTDGVPYLACRWSGFWGVASCPGALVWWGPVLVCGSYPCWDRPLVALRRRDCRRLHELVLFLSVFVLCCFVFVSEPTNESGCVLSHRCSSSRGTGLHMTCVRLQVFHIHHCLCTHSHTSSWRHVESHSNYFSNQYLQCFPFPEVRKVSKNV